MLSRFLAPGLALLLLGAVALLYRGDYASYIHILEALGAAPYRFPFVDEYTNLANLDCARIGIDVYAGNPCDVFGSKYNYSPLLLLGTHLPIGRSATWAVGLGVDLLFLASLIMLPAPRRLAEQALRVAATLSSATVYGLERANLDLAMFALIVVAAALLVHGGRMRLLAYPLLLLTAVIKYYPAVTLLVLAKERLRTFLLMAAVGGVGLAAFVALNYHNILRSLASVPSGVYFAEGFGAANLPRGLAQLLLPATLTAWRQGLGDILLLSFVLWLLLQARRWTIDLDLRDRFAMLAEAERTPLVIGALVIVGCFFAAQNIYYRAIFILMVLPGLLALTRPSGDSEHDAAARSRLRRLAATVLLLTWGEAVRHALVSRLGGPLREAALWRAADLLFWLLREVAWWSFIAMLAAIVWWFVRQSPLLSRIGSKHTGQPAPLAERVRTGFCLAE
jgi:hypothetical protein